MDFLFFAWVGASTISVTPGDSQLTSNNSGRTECGGSVVWLGGRLSSWPRAPADLSIFLHCSGMSWPIVAENVAAHCSLWYSRLLILQDSFALTDSWGVVLEAQSFSCIGFLPSSAQTAFIIVESIYRFSTETSSVGLLMLVPGCIATTVDSASRFSGISGAATFHRLGSNFLERVNKCLG